MNDLIIPILVILITTVFDALRDGWMRSAGWWKRHAVKWVQLYTPLAYIMLISNFQWWMWAALPILCWTVWRLVLTKITGRKWESWLFRLFRKG